jgi:RNase P subunit RPR2
MLDSLGRLCCIMCHKPMVYDAKADYWEGSVLKKVFTCHDCAWDFHVAVSGSAPAPPTVPEQEPRAA